VNTIGGRRSTSRDIGGWWYMNSEQEWAVAKQKEGRSGNRTRDLLHPKQESYL
jgi:hypothetical protein